MIERSEKLIEEALRGLEKNGYNALDLDVLGKAVDILKDAKTIEAMEGEYKVDIKDGKMYAEKQMDNIENTEIDDNIIMMNSHFRKYCEHKKEFQKNNDEMDKTKAMRELELFLKSMKAILQELKTSSDFQNERDMIKNHLREMFNMY